MSLPSKKYKSQLLKTKQQLMKEISGYFDVFGKFEMSKEIVVNYLMDFGNTFVATFDVIRGDEKDIRLYRKAFDYITVLGFDANDDRNVEKDIPFLIELLDYIDYDKRNK